MVAQVVIDIVDGDREGDPPPELLNVILSVGAVDADGVGDLAVGMLDAVATVDAEQRGGRAVGYAPAGRGGDRSAG